MLAQIFSNFFVARYQRFRYLFFNFKLFSKTFKIHFDLTLLRSRWEKCDLFNGLHNNSLNEIFSESFANHEFANFTRWRLKKNWEAKFNFTLLYNLFLLTCLFFLFVSRSRAAEILFLFIFHCWEDGDENVQSWSADQDSTKCVTQLEN